MMNKPPIPLITLITISQATHATHHAKHIIIGGVHSNLGGLFSSDGFV